MWAGRRDDFVRAIALEEQQIRKVAVLHLGISGPVDKRLGTKGDAEARDLDHRKVVGAVTDGERIVAWNIQFLRQFYECVVLGLAPEDRGDRAAGETARGDLERIRSVLVETHGPGDTSGEKREAA